MSTLIALSGFSIEPKRIDSEINRVGDPESELKEKAFEILKTKCNICHRKKNPFKIFSKKNMDRRASKIYKQVFIKQRMPKGDEIQLTDEEYRVLDAWIQSIK